jgi:hypothetical protein
MWGNRLGWVISALIVAAYIAGFAWLVRGINEASAATAFVTEGPAISPILLPVPPAMALPSMTEARDAGPLYQQAIADYRANQQKYDRFLEAAPGTAAGLPPSEMKAIDLLIQATPMTQLTLFSHNPESIVHYGETPDLTALDSLGNVALRLGLLRQNGDANDRKRAQQYYEAAFSLGAKLYEDRLTYRELMTGVRLLGDAGVQLAKLARKANDNSHADTLEKFNTSRLQLFQSTIQPMARVLNSIDSKVIAQHAGDVMYLAEHAAERLWRIEAIFALGRMRFFVGENGRAGDQRSAVRILKQLSNDPDPAIRAAVSAAQSLTLEQYRMLS